MKSLVSKLVATVLVNLFLVAGGLALATLAVVSGTVRPKSRVPYLCARWWARGLVLLAGLDLRVDRETELDPDEQYVFFVNHQSLYDIPVMLQTLPVDARFLAKQSLFVIPVFGFAMRKAGFVPVERGAGPAAAKRSLREAAGQLTAGHSILLFPEETRSTSGRILPFKTGGLLIALRSGARIVPVGVRGTRRVRPKGSFLTCPGPVTVRYGAPVDPKDGGVREKRRVLEELRREISRLSGEPLVEEAIAEVDVSGTRGNGVTGEPRR